MPNFVDYKPEAFATLLPPEFSDSALGFWRLTLIFLRITLLHHLCSTSHPYSHP